MIGVFGAIGWHALAKVDSGTMDMVINGAGYDIALAFSSLQVPTSFASSVSDGKTAELMKMDLEEHGLTDLLLREPGLPFTGSVAWYERGEERLMRAHPAFDLNYPVSFLENIVKKNDTLIVELGFKETTLQTLVMFADMYEKKILWIVRDENAWKKLQHNPAWQKFSVFVGPHAYDKLPDYIRYLDTLKKTGFAAITKNANMLLIWHNESHQMLRVSESTLHPEYRFSNIVAALVNEMTSWELSLVDAAQSCAGAFESWVDLQDTGGADLERKVATFYKKVENLEHDALTGLLSRGAAEKILGSKQLDTPLSMILIDVDHFKRVNDTLGHHIGDKVLVSVASKISREVRDKDLAVRWGGEEFVILLPGCPQERASVIAERIREKMHQIRTELGHVTASFGVAERADHEPLEEWFVRVDALLYQAKNQGRDRVISYSQSNIE